MLKMQQNDYFTLVLGAVAPALFTQYVVLKAYVSYQNTQGLFDPCLLPCVILAIISDAKLRHVLTILSTSREQNMNLTDHA